MNKKVFSQSFTVPASAIDAMGHVNNLVYLQWCLDAAEKHWKGEATTKMLKDYVWYVLRHEVHYKASAFEGDILRVDTWVEHSEGVKSKRNYSITRPSDNKLIVEASTDWCLLDASTLRPIKIPSELVTLFQEN